MTTTENYHGIDILEPEPTGDGGLLIQDNFKALADWRPRSVYDKTAAPTEDDDGADDFRPGSLWLRTDTAPPTLFLCVSADEGAADWRPVPLEIELARDAAPALGGDLDVGGHAITSSANGNVLVNPHGVGKVGIGTASPPAKFSVVNGAKDTDGAVTVVQTADLSPIALYTGIVADASAEASQGFYIDALEPGVSDNRVLVLQRYGGNVGVGTNRFGSGADRVLSVKTGTAPSSDAADQFSLYSADVAAGNAAPHFRTESGDVVRLYRQAAIGDADAGSVVAKFNALLGYLRNLGLVGT